MFNDPKLYEMPRYMIEPNENEVEDADLEDDIVHENEEESDEDDDEEVLENSDPTSEDDESSSKR